jgi:PAS domain S-box-containing protein
MKMDRPKRILILEDLETDAILAQREISATLQDCIFRQVETKDEFLAALEDFHPDAIVADYQLPEFDGLSALEIALEKAPLVPVIMHTGSLNEDTAVECMRKGATDYVIKNHIKRLGPAVQRAYELSALKQETLLHQKSLVESEERFRTFAENATDLIYRFDFAPERKFTYVSPSSKAITGYTPEQYYGDPDLAVKMVHPDDKEILKAMSSGEIQTGKPLLIRWITSGGNVIWLEHKNAYKYDSSGMVVSVEGIARDVTERITAEEEIRKALEKAEESDRLKTAFLNNLSHEIRTPLNAITGFTDMLRDPGISGDQIRRCLNIIQQSSNQLISVVEDIIYISTIETGQLEIHESEFSISQLCERVKSRFTDKAALKQIEIGFSFRHDNNGNIILSDLGKLDYVVSHLVDNAIKFTDRGSVKVRCDLNHEMKTLQFSVSDTGIGIEPAMHDKLFKRFSQSSLEISQQRGGLGLGLSISKSFIELLGGQIGVESVPGSGSVFYFTVPFKPVPGKTTGAVRNNKPGKNLLIAEDEESNFMLLKEILRDSGFTILHAINGEQAVRLVKEHPEIDLVIMDIKMPLMDGYEATKHIKKMRPSLPVIALTAQALAGDHEIALEAGCDSYFSKPFIPAELIKTINKYIG